MKRIKVIGDPTELVPMLRAVDTEVKRKVFQEVISDWKTMKEIEEKYGEEGKRALMFFEKMKLVETRWQTKGNAPEKAYRTYYMSFHINTSCLITEITDVLSAATMSDKEFKRIEKRILEMVKDGGRFAGDIAEELKISDMMLKALIKRSSVLDYKGHRVEKMEEDVL